jgi:hypothetical protein
MRRRLAGLLISALLATGATCAPHRGEVSRDQAIATARQQARFAPVAAEATREVEEGRAVWRVMLKGPPLAPDQPLLFDSLLVILDRRTGGVISAARP